MVFLSLTAFVLTALGFWVLAQRILGSHRSPRFLADRRIDAHLWGFHLLGAGSMLALAAWVLRGRTWSDLSGPTGIVLGSAVLWAAAALGMDLAAVLRPRVARTPFLPPPETPTRRWTPVYRGFLGMGFVALLGLALLAF